MKKSVEVYISLIGLLLGYMTASAASEQEIATPKALTTSVALKVLGKSLEAEVTFTNSSDSPLYVYFIDSPIFNSFQSRFYLLHQNGKKSFVLQEPHPHGYSVNISDFHLIDANDSKTFLQKIEYFDLIERSKPLILEWVYENKITKWEGEKETIDGKTKTLFDGETIPGIWVGKIKASTEIKL